MSINTVSHVNPVKHVFDLSKDSAKYLNHRTVHVPGPSTRYLVPTITMLSTNVHLKLYVLMYGYECMYCTPY